MKHWIAEAFIADFTHNLFAPVYPTALLIIQIYVLIGATLKHCVLKDGIMKLLYKKSYATTIRNIISFILYAVKRNIMLWCKNFIDISVVWGFLTILVTVATNKKLVNNVIEIIIPYVLYFVKPVLSDDSITSIDSFLQPSLKLVCSYDFSPIRIIIFFIHANISLLLFGYIVIFYIVEWITDLFPDYHRLVALIIAFVLDSIASRSGPICEFKKQANTNKQNTKVDRQDPIKVQKQLDTDLKSATVHNQASNDTQKQLRMLKDDQQKLQNDHQNIKNDQQKLQNEKQKLHHDHQKLQNDHHKLQNEKPNLQNDHQKLQNDHQKLQNEKPNLHHDHQKLQNEHQKLHDKHQNLQNDQQKLHDHLVLPKIKDEKLANTNQQNAKVDRQDLIKAQKQLNTDLKTATVHKQASNDDHKQLQMLKYSKKLKVQIWELKQAKHAAEKMKAKTEIKKNEEIQELLKKIHQLELELEHEKRKSQMSNDKISQVLELNNELKQKYDEKMETIQYLFSRIKQLKATECQETCVTDVTRRICQTKVPGVNFQLYRRPLEKIIIKEAAEKIEKNDLKCDQLMEILEKDKIVTRDAEYNYLSEEEDKLQVIDEAWDRLMSIDSNKRVLILGRVISYANKKGHAELCDLDTRHDEEVKIYNPATDKEEWTNQEDFRDYVLGDEGLRLYTVNLEKLTSIIEEYKDIF